MLTCWRRPGEEKRISVQTLYNSRCVKMVSYLSEITHPLCNNCEHMLPCWLGGLVISVTIFSVDLSMGCCMLDKSRKDYLVLLRLFISSNEVCKTAYALYHIHEQNSIFKNTIMGPMIPNG